MKYAYLLLAGASALLIAACSPSADVEPSEQAATDTPEVEETDIEAPAETATIDAPAATYALDPAHAFLSATIVHMGVSDYTIDFTSFDAEVALDPENLEASSIDLTIDPMGVNVNYPGDYKAGHADSPYDTWQEALSRDPDLLNADTYPEISFVSTGIERTGDATGLVTGDLTFLGETHPVTMDVTFNGATESRWTPGQTLIGFTATGTIDRFEFGHTSMEPYLSKDIRIKFSGEFQQVMDAAAPEGE